MLHAISREKFGPFGAPMADAVQACVHCGFCLAACPTYSVLGQEMDTPRGRIVLMKQVLEGELPRAAALPHIERCLGCLACEPACPSGVPYRNLINPFRALGRTAEGDKRTFSLRSLLETQVLPFADRFRLAALAGRLARPISSVLPTAVRPMLELLPRSIPAPYRPMRVTPALGKRRARVALLLGCVQQVLEPDINAATIEVLSRNGVEVVIPPNQGCCGGLAWHTGDWKSAQRFARGNLLAFTGEFDAIVTNAAGCGSTMQEYGLILKGSADEPRATRFADRVLDVSRFLAGLGLRMPLGSVPQKAVYQDACHLAHAQNVHAEPRALLRAIPGLDLVEMADPHLCCGSAGTYNLDQPEIADALGKKKARAILDSGAQMVVSGNIGCMTQLRAHLAKLGSPIAVRHTVQVLREAYHAGDSASDKNSSA
jgi:glycolate oxidase iron-sulfur subunit